MKLVDTHCHLINQSRLRYPWLEEVPALNRDATLDEYLPQARAAGITDILFMEVDVDPAQIEDEVAWAGSLPEVAGVIAACRPEADGFAAQLERLAGDARVKGLRRILHTTPGWLAAVPEFATNLKLLPAHGLSFDLCVRPDQLRDAAALVRACPEVSFVLDHCGNPPLGGDLEAWRGGIAALAGWPNLVCKLSGLVNHVGPGWTPAALVPAIEWVLERFGPSRMVWGSDWPVCTLGSDLAGWVVAARGALAGLSEEEQADVFWRTAHRIYRLG